MKFLTALLLTGLALGVTGGCASRQPAGGAQGPVVSGTVNYRARIALPADAVLTLRLLDVTRPDAPAIVIAEKSVSNPGNPPIAFELPYLPGDIRAGRQIVIDARIEVAGRPRFYAEKPHPVTPDSLYRSHEVWVELTK
ncbi:MAG TPA: YbaY family lipoprotein [Opitutaceae bacterium]|nr:YbaY family lipoprotein [Opitutaceae bacterium]HRJ48759.1 YbaY family lipoprotein [Opitutaceae bacterium]